jgi:hypothetical protein
LTIKKLKKLVCVSYQCLLYCEPTEEAKVKWMEKWGLKEEDFSEENMAKVKEIHKNTFEKIDKR